MLQDGDPDIKISDEDTILERSDNREIERSPEFYLKSLEKRLDTIVSSPMSAIEKQRSVDIEQEIFIQNLSDKCLIGSEINDSPVRLDNVSFIYYVDMASGLSFKARDEIQMMHDSQNRSASENVYEAMKNESLIKKPRKAGQNDRLYVDGDFAVEYVNENASELVKGMYRAYIKGELTYLDSFAQQLLDSDEYSVSNLQGTPHEYYFEWKKHSKNIDNPSDELEILVYHSIESIRETAQKTPIEEQDEFLKKEIRNYERVILHGIDHTLSADPVDGQPEKIQGQIGGSK
jgi:hypothetical protein